MEQALRIILRAVLLAKFAFPVCLSMACLSAAESDGTAQHLKDLSSSELEQRLAEIERQLEGLARHSMRGGVGAIGYRSRTYRDSKNVEWIQIDLDRQCPVDEIVLVPSIWRDTEVGFIDDGFPVEFSVIAGSSESPDEVVLAQLGPKDRFLPRIAPLVIPCSGTRASWIRLQATTLSPRAWDAQHLLQLSEIMVFSGEENVALRQRVRASSRQQIDSAARKREFLVDGFVPYLMDAQTGAQSIAFLGAPAGSERATITIDLEATETLNRIHLHSLDLSDTVPQSAADLGTPRRLVVEGATRSDFSDAVQLIEYRMESIYDVGPILMWRFPNVTCRYVRLTVLESSFRDVGRSTVGSSIIGFAEIELFAEGRNVALGKPVSTTLVPVARERSKTALTDGRNLYGRILPTRGWLNELALRHDLETQRPLVVAELNERYQWQKVYLNWLIWATVILGAGTVCMVLIHRIVRQRALFRMRERIAADLHDELGANIHAIGLLGDLAQSAAESPEKLNGLLQRIRALTERSGAAARYCVNMLESQGLYDDLVEDMRRTSSRIMSDLDHEIAFEGEGVLQRLPQRKRIDLFLFYKECLINILRHSGATRVTTQLKGEPRELCLTITDNGCGLPDALADCVPPSLKRRARLLGAHVSARPADDGGTSITLRLRIKKPWISR